MSGEKDNVIMKVDGQGFPMTPKKGQTVVFSCWYTISKLCAIFARAPFPKQWDHKVAKLLKGTGLREEEGIARLSVQISQQNLH